MSRLTDLIEEKFDPKKHKSMRNFLLMMDINQQKFNGWKDGAVPDEKTICAISNALGINFLKLLALAKISDARGNSETKAEWKKIATQIEREEKGDSHRILT